MDWKTTVDQLMKIEQIPQDALKAKQAAGTKVQSAYDTLKTNLTALQTAAVGLQTGISGYPRSAAVSGYDPVARTYSSSSGASVSTASGATLGTFQFEVTSMGKASTLTGLSDSLRASVASAGDLKLSDYGVSEGIFTLNGTKYTLTSEDLDKSVKDFFGLSDDGAGGLTGNSVNATAVDGITVTIDAVTGALKMAAGTSIGAAGDTSSFLAALGLEYSPDAGTPDTVFQQFMPASTLGRVTLGGLSGGAGLGAAVDLTINGVSVGQFGSDSTLGSVVSAINGNSATGVTASIDSVNGKLRLTANSIGAMGINVNAGDGLAAALGIDGPSVDRGTGVLYNLTHNGTTVALTSDSATLDISKYGYGATQLTVSNKGTYSVQVTGSGASYKSKINTFITAYNSLKQMLDDSTKITVGADGKVQASVFSSRADINNLLSTIRAKIYTPLTDASISSTYNTASKIGLGFDSSGVLSITDSAKLDSALANSPSSVDALLNLNANAVSSTPSGQQGIATRINNLMKAMTATGGLVAAAKTSLTSQNKRLQSQIDAMTRSLTQTRASLERGFIAMEQAQSKYQSMTQQLTAAFK